MQHLGLRTEPLGDVVAAELLVLLRGKRALPYLVLDDRPEVSLGEVTAFCFCRAHACRRSCDVVAPPCETVHRVVGGHSFGVVDGRQGGAECRDGNAFACLESRFQVVTQAGTHRSRSQSVRKSRRTGRTATVAIWLYDTRMPRVVDHDQRRAQIARAFQRLLAAEGFAGVSFARVATEAGVSVGLIQHYFTGKDALLRFAYEDAVHRMSERVRVRVRNGEAAGLPIAEVLLDSLVELLPLDAEREVEYRARQGLQAQALNHPGLADVARRSGGDILGYVTRVVEDGIARGEVESGVDAVPAARMILATTQGLADQVALSGPDAFSARDVLGRAIATVFTGSRGH